MLYTNLAPVIGAILFSVFDDASVIMEKIIVAGRIFQSYQNPTSYINKHLLTIIKRCYYCKNMFQKYCFSKEHKHIKKP